MKKVSQIVFRNTVKFLFVFILQIVALPIVAQAPGNLDGSDTICSNNNFGSLTLNGNIGSILRWELASSANGPWSTMQYTQASYAYQNITQTTYFRVITKFGSFPELTSTVAGLICVQTPASFLITTPTLQCSNLQSTAAVVANPTTSILWEYSTNNWSTVVSLSANPAYTISTPAIVTPYLLRAKTSNKYCPIVYSNTLAVQIASLSVAGSIAGATAICGVSNACTLSATNYSGNIETWESATAPTGPFAPIPGSSNLSALPLANILQSTYYRIKVQNGTCPISTSVSHSLQVTMPSVSGFIVGTNSLCAAQANATLNLLGYTGTTIVWEKFVNSSWQPIGGTTSTLIQITPTVSGLYRAVVQNGICPAVTSNTHILTVHPKPTVSFTCANSCMLAANIFSTSGSNVYLAQWNFGDGNTSSLYSPSHSYSVAGNYTASLKCFSQFGCADSTSRSLIVYPLPQANFISADSLCGTASYTFINSSSISSGSIQSITYNFGDGNSAATALASHSFALPGTYNVSQTASSNFGCTASTQKLVHVLPKPICNFLVTNACPNTPILLQNTSFVSNGFLNHKWQFGNGDTSSIAQVNYQYNIAGTYNIKLTVTSNLGCEDALIKQIQIQYVPSVSLSNYTVCSTKPLLLSAQLNSSTNLASSNFKLGDGSSVSTFSVLHKYQSPGVYPLEYSAITDSGCVVKRNAFATVYAQPRAALGDFASCKNESVALQNLSTISTGTLSYLWAVNNSSTFTNIQPQTDLLPVGTNSIQLIAVSQNGCSDTLLKTIEVNPLPQLSLDNTSACVQSNAVMSPSISISSGSIQAFVWKINGNVQANTQVVNFNALSSGNYEVTLECTSDKNCKSSTAASLRVYPKAIAGFSYTALCNNSEVKLINTSKNANASFSSIWKIDTMTIGNLDVTLSKLSAGYHTVQLITKTDKACMDTLHEKVFVAAASELLIAADSIVNLGSQIYLSASGATSYTWFPATSLTDVYSPSPLFTAQQSITYTLLANSEQNCVSSKTLAIRVLKNYALDIHNVITLNDNTLNDHFHISNIEAYPTNTVMVFDQNNQIVFSQANYQNTWQARNAHGEQLAPGTYYYRISFGDTEKVYQGSLLVVKE